MPLMLGALAWALGLTLAFACLFGAQVLLSVVSRTVWLPNALTVAVVALFGIVPQLRTARARLAVAAMFGSAALLAYLSSVPRPVEGSSAETLLALATPCLLVLLAFGAVIYVPLLFTSAGSWMLASLVLLAAVAYFSGSAGGTGGGAWDRWLSATLGISLEAAGILVVTGRKIAHFAFYGFLARNAWRAARAGDASPAGAAVFGISMAAAGGAFDEIRQSTVPDRTGQPLDFLIDIAGALAFVLAFQKSSISRAKRQVDSDK